MMTPAVHQAWSLFIIALPTLFIVTILFISATILLRNFFSAPH